MSHDEKNFEVNARQNIAQEEDVEDVTDILSLSLFHPPPAFPQLTFLSSRILKIIKDFSCAIQ